MAGIGHMARKVTDSLTAEALRIMKAGFRDKKSSAAIAREIGEAKPPCEMARSGSHFQASRITTASQGNR